MNRSASSQALGWAGVFRLGLVQVALGAIIVLTTSTLNRVMVVELALPASLPGLLVGWHYAVQITRPRWGYGADHGGRRSRWILAGMAVLGLGAIMAAAATALISVSPVFGILATFVSFTLIGGGVGAAGTNLLALLAIRTQPERKAAAAAIVWIMMIAGFILTTAVAGSFLDPFSMQRLFFVTCAVSFLAFVLSAAALFGMEGNPSQSVEAPQGRPQEAGGFADALREVWADGQARRFTIFVFVSMLAYSAQDLILEPFAGLVFGYTPGESTKLAATQNSGVLLGMIGTAIVGTLIGKSRAGFMRRWTLVGCAASAAALVFLSFGAFSVQTFPLHQAVFALGVANGMFAVAAIGSMMTLASAGPKKREGTRMGVWGAAQAVAFGAGGLFGAVGLDLSRSLFGDLSLSFAMIFMIEAGTFIAAGLLALWVGRTDADATSLPFMPAESFAAE